MTMAVMIMMMKKTSPLVVCVDCGDDEDNDDEKDIAVDGVDSNDETTMIMLTTAPLSLMRIVEFSPTAIREATCCAVRSVIKYALKDIHLQ